MGLVLISSLALAPLARADKAQDARDADRYFKEGQTLMEESEYAKACPKFEQSYKLDPKTGTQLNLAFCYEKEGRVWYAWLAYKEAELRASASGQKERADFARAQAINLEKGLARARIPAQSGLDRLAVDDQTIPDATRGQPFAVEPGSRKVTFVKSGKKPVVREIRIVRQAAPQVLEVPTAFEDEELPPVVAPPPAVEAPPPIAPPPPADPARKQSPDRTLALAAFGVGAIGLGTGAVLGVMTLTTRDEADANCPNKVCDRVGQDKIATARTYGVISTIGFVVGAIGVAGGATLYLLAPADGKGASVGPSIGPGMAGLTARGRFAP
jgi:hypothetical protein